MVAFTEVTDANYDHYTFRMRRRRKKKKKKKKKEKKRTEKE